MWICSRCGSQDARRINGFDGWFFGLWAATTLVAFTLLPPLLFLALFIAAIVKTVKALFGSGSRCGACGSQELVPAESPVGQKLYKELHG